MKQRNIADEPNVVILLTTYKDPPLLNDILASIKRTRYSNFELLVVDCRSNNVRQTLEAARLKVPVHFVPLERDDGAAHQLNEGMLLAMNKEVKYIVRLEGDAIPQGFEWLRELVRTMESSEAIAIAMPFDLNKRGEIGYGGRLYGNCTYCIIDRPQISRIIPCLGTGGHCFITRKAYIGDLFEKGIKPYWDPFYISSEDLDFNLKAWLASYKVVTVGSVRVLHEGTSMPKDQSYRAPYRIYHMYKNRVCMLLFNFGYKHILVNIWYRFLNDVLSALIHSELILLFKGYYWVLANLKEVMKHRALRMTCWKLVHDEELKDIVLVKWPMPLKR